MSEGDRGEVYCCYIGPLYEENGEQSENHSIYQSINVPVLTYGPMFWLMNKREGKKNHSAKQRILRRVVRISIRDIVESWAGTGIWLGYLPDAFKTLGQTVDMVSAYLGSGRRISGLSW